MTRDNAPARIEFGCPRCQTRLAVEASAVGRRVRCPVCQFETPVPTARQAAARAPKAGPDAEYALRGAAGSGAADSLTVACPVCATRITAARDEVGRKVRCPDCDTLVEVRLPVESARPKHSVPLIAAEEEYPIWGVGQPPPDATAVYQTYIPVECALCRTRMLATEAEVGRKLVCPDCGTATVVPSPARPVLRPVLRPAAVAAADRGEPGYAVRAGGESGIATPDGYAAWFPVVCPRCSTRLHAAPEQVGQEMVCPDCATRIEVCAPAAGVPKIGPPPDVDGGYKVGAAQAPSPWKPIFASVFAESESADRCRAKAAVGPKGEPAGERLTEEEPQGTRVARRDLLPPSDTAPPSLWRCTVGFLLMETVWPRWLVFSGTMMATFCLLRLATWLGSVNIIPMWIVSMGYSGISSVAAILWLAVFFANAVVVATETAAGTDSIEGWPDGPYQDWMPDAFYVFNALAFSAIPGVAADWTLVDVGAPAGTWSAASLFLGFPIVLLSMLERGSAVLPLAGLVAASLLGSWWAWGLFYAAAVVLLLGGVAAALLAFGVLGAWGIVVAAPIGVGVLLVYFRMLGRLAMTCGRRLS